MRGLYISLNSEAIGNYTLPDFKQNIIGNDSKEKILLDMLHADEYRSISIYDLNSIFASPHLTNRLAQFITSAKAGGITEVHAPVMVPAQIDTVIKFNSIYPNMFTGLVSEFEFWTPGGGSFTDFLKLLKHMGNYALTKSAYLGWLKVSGLTRKRIASKIAALIDRIYLHAYVTDPINAFQYVQSRIDYFIDTEKPLQFMPIYSAEGPGKSAGKEVYMGEWLEHNSMAQADMVFLYAYNAHYPNPNNITLVGFQYFEYGFLS